LGLTPATYYYYQLIISSGTTPSSSNASYGNIVRFKTAAADPVATTLGTTGYTTTSATLTGSILANDNIVSPKFCYSETPTATAGILTEANCIGGLVSASPSSVSVGTSAINLVISGLTTGHTYYYQAVGVYNSTSKVYGAIKSFTLGAPTVTTLSATGVKLTSGSSWEALLNGYINPNGGIATNYFCIAETNTVTARGAMTQCVTGGGAIALESATATTLTNAAPITLSKTGLTASTTYYFQAIGRNLSQAPSLDQYGEVLSFVTAFAPSVTTSQVTLFGIDTATVPGIITANGALTTGSFCLSTSNASTDGILNSCQFTFTTTPSTTSGSNVSITADAIGLTQATTYYYQAIGDNSQGTSYGEILNFTTLAGAPIATTVAASNVANTTATINGRVNPSGAATTVKFCWGTSNTLSGCTLTDTITVVSASAGLTSASLNLTGLTTGTTYYFRIEGTNSQGSAQGSIFSFKAGAPSVQTLPATEITGTTAVLNGTAKANAANTSAVKFCLSDASTLTNGELTCNQSTPLGSKNASQQVVLSSATSVTQETVTVTGLTSGTTYYFQIQATAGGDTTFGDVLSFAAGAPIGITKSATSIASASAQLNGLVNRVNDSSASARFCLADAEDLNPDGSLATCLQSVDVPDTQLVTLTTDDQVYVDATGLAPGNTYFFQIATTGTGGSSIGQVFSFSTGFAVTFDANGGTGAMNDQAAMSTTALTLNAFSKAGYSFGGWSRTAGGAVAFADGANYDFTANITLYAIWNAVATTPTPPPSTPLLKSKLTWANPAPISQGTPLSGTQLNANPEVPSTCVYTPALGTVLAAGTYTLSVVCTPLDSNYEPTSGTVTLVVKSKTKPKITWFNPTPITNPTPLSGTQLNATANVPGKYTYNPAAGTVLAPGKHPLNVKFSPDDKETYEELEANVTISVLGENAKAEPTPSAPVSQPDIKTGQTPPTGIVLQTSGKVDFIKVVKTQQPLGVLITAPDWSLRLSSTTQFVSGTTQDTNDRVVIEKGNTVTTSGTGFKPFSQVDIWVYSTPTWLGAVVTDAFGNFTTTVPMPKALPAGDHTFQAMGQTPESTVRKADVPITLVNPTVKGEPGSLNFEVYFGMNSPIVTNAEKKRIAKLVKLAQSKIASGAKVTVEVSGWVQPNPNPGNIKYLSTHRADNVANALRAIGLKAAYTKKYPGLAKDNIPTARHASVLIKWSKSK
jgi:outer membrane protein OmpA-like peptidoglycan-associated protein